jgi:hypothetical protein
MQKLNVIYRLSDNGYVKEKYPHATKIACLKNAVHSMSTEVKFHLFVDTTKLSDETKNEVERLSIDFAHKEYYIGGSSAGSWRHVFDYAIKTFKSEDIIYFLEDDYLHKQYSDKIILEGLNFGFDYVSLYDHKDKYIPASQGGNQFIGDDCGELTKVFVTDSVHWKLTNSTTMTFATKHKQLVLDKETWEKYTLGNHSNDYMCFLQLRGNGRTLATPLPGYSTHCEPRWASPLTNWNFVI